MKDIFSKVVEKLVSVQVNIIITVCMVVALIVAGLFKMDMVVAMVVIRVLFCLINFIIASFVMGTGKRPLFLLCIYLGIMCSLLYQVWTLCNYVWAGDDNGMHVISALSNISFFLFLFTASYGALDSLADDRTKRFRKYRITAILVTILWMFGINSENAVSTCIVGGAITILTYIVIKHIFIPDVENGFVVTLKNYYIVLLLLIVERLAELMIADMDISQYYTSILRFIGSGLQIWIFPLAYRGTKKWISM